MHILQKWKSDTIFPVLLGIGLVKISLLFRLKIFRSIMTKFSGLIFHSNSQVIMLRKVLSNILVTWPSIMTIANFFRQIVHFYVCIRIHKVSVFLLVFFIIFTLSFFCFVFASVNLAFFYSKTSKVWHTHSDRHKTLIWQNKS